MKFGLIYTKVFHSLYIIMFDMLVPVSKQLASNSLVLLFGILVRKEYSGVGSQR